MRTSDVEVAGTDAKNQNGAQLVIVWEISNIYEGLFYCRQNIGLFHLPAGLFVFEFTGW